MSPSRPRPIRPLGQPTRGKTALNRLRQIDVYVALALPGVLTYGAPLVVDVGFGAFPWTTLEMRERWLDLNPRLCVLGIEIDPERVEGALPYKDPADPAAIDFCLAGFNLQAVLGGRQVRLIRCYNVLRQYEESAVEESLAAMAEVLEPGGILIEGTSNPTGRIVAFDVYEKVSQKVGQPLTHRALVFGTNFHGTADPGEFQTILPKRLIHRALDPAPAAFFGAWNAAVAQARGAGRNGHKALWIGAARLLRTRFNLPVDGRDRIIRRGFLPVYDGLT